MCVMLWFCVCFTFTVVARVSDLYVCLGVCFHFNFIYIKIECCVCVILSEHFCILRHVVLLLYLNWSDGRCIVPHGVQCVSDARVCSHYWGHSEGLHFSFSS